MSDIPLITGNFNDSLNQINDLINKINSLNQQFQTSLSIFGNIKFKNVTGNINFTLPANTIVSSVYYYCKSGVLSSLANGYIINSSNPYPNLESAASLNNLAAGTATTVPSMFLNFNTIENVSNVPLNTTIDISDGTTIGNGWNGATLDIIVQTLTFE